MYNAVVVQEVLQRSWEPWRWRLQWLAIGNENDQLRAIIEADPLKTTQEVAKELNVTLNYSLVLPHLKQIGDMWKSSKSFCLMSWPQIENIVFLKFHFLLFCAATRNCFLIGLWCGTKSEFYMTTSSDGSVIGPEEASKCFPKPDLYQKMSRSLFGGLLLVWSTAAFWIPAKPLHLTSMLSRSMKCTKNCNASCQHWSTERAQFFSTATPNCMSHSQRFRSWTNWATKSHPPYSPNLLPTDYHFFKHVNNFLRGKHYYNQQETENAFQEFTESWSTDFYATGINKLFSLAKVCWL